MKLDPRAVVTAEYRRGSRQLCAFYVLVALVAGFALGVLFTVLEVAR